MTPAVVSASCHPPKAGAVLGVTNGCLLPMAAWVVVGRPGGFVQLQVPVSLHVSGLP